MQAIRLAFIGGGNMAGAIFGGLLAQGWPAGAIQVVEPWDEQRARLAAQQAAPYIGGALQLSVMAGIRSDAIAQAAGTERVVRAMPNTPALIGRGIAGLVALSLIHISEPTRPY